jgi:N-carbamoylsarcosine amidase
MTVSPEVQNALNVIFDKDSSLYKGRGWNQRVGYGKSIAILNIDLANAWTRKGYRFTCDDMDEQIIPGTQRLLAAARKKSLPIIYTTTAFCSRFDIGAFPLRGPWEDLMLGTPGVEIDDRVAPVDGVDTLIVKKRPSAFAGTHLAGILRAGGIDTLICTGVTMAGCVRHTIEDALGEGIKTVVVRECVGDRVAAAIEWNLFDLDMKWCDVEALDDVIAHLEGNQVPTYEYPNG